MKSVGRLDSPSLPHRDHSPRTPSKDFAHELAKAGDEHARETPDRYQAATPSGLSEKASIDAINASIPATGGLGNNQVVPPVPAVARPSQALNVDNLTTIHPSKGSSSTILLGSTQIPTLMDSVVSRSTPTAPALTAFGYINAIHADLEQIVQPTGITEALIGSRIYGVHLLADPYLSELVDSPSEAKEQGENVTPSIGGIRPASVSAGETNRSLAENGLDAADIQQEEIVTALTLLADGDESASVNIRTSSPFSATAAEASTALWPESSIRLTKQRDGSAVIWLRDYRANKDDASQLVDAMIKASNAKGMRLGRIVLNGREVWTSRNDY